MAPLISKGDAVISRQTDVLDLRNGDIVSYQSPDPTVVITHRVVSVDPLTGQIVTKGDANASADVAFDGNRLLGEVAYTIPKAGVLVGFLRSWPGLVLVVYVPIGLVVLAEMRRLARYYMRPTYKLPSYGA